MRISLIMVDGRRTSEHGYTISSPGEPDGSDELRYVLNKHGLLAHSLSFECFTALKETHFYISMAVYNSLKSHCNQLCKPAKTPRM